MNRIKKAAAITVTAILIGLSPFFFGYQCKAKPIEKNVTTTTTTVSTTTVETTLQENIASTQETLEKKIEGMKITAGAFNIQIFGQSKLAKKEVMEILVDIVGKYDILAVQEVRDIEGVVIPSFLEMINKEYNGIYKVVASEPLGRSTSKENYAFIYNSQKINIIKSFVYDDVNDDFERDPFIVVARYGKSDATFIVVHTKPADAPSEIDNLVKVIAYADARNGEDSDIITEGDFNMAPTYYTLTRYTELMNKDKYVMLITNEMKTTLSGKPFDRAFMTKSALEDYVDGSAGAYEYFQEQEIIKIMQENNVEKKDVSDHLPILYQLEEGHDTDLIKN